MKTRTSLVSNSSTTSFLIIGFSEEYPGSSDKKFIKGLYFKLFGRELSDEEIGNGDYYDEIANYREKFDILIDGEGSRIFYGATLFRQSSEYCDFEDEMFDLSAVLLKSMNAKATLGLSGDAIIYRGQYAS